MPDSSKTFLSEVLVGEYNLIKSLVMKSKVPQNIDPDIVREVDLHCVRVGRMCYMYGLLSGWAESEAFQFRKAGYLHDLGKYFLPQEILTKSGPLTPEEFNLVKRHPALGANKYLYISNLTHGERFCHSTFLIIMQHHERWDGEGYPHKHSRDQIEKKAQVVSLMDYMEALCADRCYRDAFPFKVALELLVQQRGTAFNPTLVDHFLRHKEEYRKIIQSHTIPCVEQRPSDLFKIDLN